MIKQINPQENLGDDVLFRENEKDVVWHIGFIDGLYGDSYNIKYADKRLSGDGTKCSIDHKPLYIVPSKLFTGEMDENELEEHLKNSPDYISRFGTRDYHIEIIIKNLDTILDHYQHNSKHKEIIS